MLVKTCLTLFIFCLTYASCGDHPDGVSQVARAQDPQGNYEFSYAVNNGEGEHFRREGTDNLGRVVGSYGLTHSDGRQRVVDYIADKAGFRAQVRTNEPGMMTSGSDALTVIKTNYDSPLAVAASSQGGFGTRIKTSRVAYVEPEKVVVDEQEKIDNSPKESRQRSFDDYRPQSPVAYYPGDAVNGPKPISRPTYDSGNTNNRQSVLPPESADYGRPLDVYLPPIDPHSAVRSPGYYLPRNENSDSSFPSSTTSRRPFIPPYGGFDDDPLPLERRPGVSMSTVHGGGPPNQFNFAPTPPTALYGAGRYPSADLPAPRPFSSSHFPPKSDVPSFPRFPGSLMPSPPQNHPNVMFNPPSYEGGNTPSNFVLRAVPIPNGIQAVRVDPNTGRVYDRVEYPLFLRDDGHPDYDRNILLHNGEIGDDDATRNDNQGYLDVSFRRRPSYRSARNPSFDEDHDFRNSRQRLNESNGIDLRSLSIPTAKDIAWVHLQLAGVEGFDRNRYPNEMLLRDEPARNSRYPDFDNFEEISSAPRSPYLQPRFPAPGSLEYSESDEQPENINHSESLTPLDSKEVKVSNLKTSSSEKAETRVDA